ncbi:LysR family transcriptional regulator [Streptomyces sp. NPDC055966]|uniref:LysR family transcriptional regulator n=1 Tax=Streptomyces sp. NPDC055966 TaxID=3345669 RepID=UPI0035D80134
MATDTRQRHGPETGTRIWDLNLKHLQAFLAVADTLSFTSAADQLGSNQPTLTRSVRRLEEQLGVPLFLRTTRQVSLSPDGVRLRDRLRELLPHLSRALFPEPERPALRLGFSWLLPDGWVQEAIRRFEQETGARVELRRRDDRWADRLRVWHRTSAGDEELLALDTGSRPVAEHEKTVVKLGRMAADVARFVTDGAPPAQPFPGLSDALALQRLLNTAEREARTTGPVSYFPGGRTLLQESDWERLG